jgi:hypothetical protein
MRLAVSAADIGVAATQADVFAAEIAVFATADRQAHVAAVMLLATNRQPAT